MPPVASSPAPRRRAAVLPAGLFSLLLAAALAAATAQARPERIRPGVSYYSDAYEVTGGVADLVGEKNYEEVYRFYNYYEAVYDERDRVVRFIAYERGEVVWRERYLYGPDGRATAKQVSRDGKTATVPLPAGP